MNQEKLQELIVQLGSQGVLSAEEQSEYRSALTSSGVESVQGQLLARLNQKLLETDAAVLDTSLQYSDALRQLAEVTGDATLQQTATELDSGIKSELESFQTEMNDLSDVHEGIRPLLEEIEREAERV